MAEDAAGVVEEGDEFGLARRPGSLLYVRAKHGVGLPELVGVLHGEGEAAFVVGAAVFGEQVVFADESVEGGGGEALAAEQILLDAEAVEVGLVVGPLAEMGKRGIQGIPMIRASGNSRKSIYIILYDHSSWDKQVLMRKMPKPKFNKLRVILIDEKAVRKGHNYVTVVMNGDTREVIYMAEGRKKETLLAFFDLLKPAQKQRIEAVGIDRAGAYLAAIREAIPHAVVVFDKFHIIKNMNDALDKVRRAEYSRAIKAKSPSARLIQGQRFNLFRLPENRTETQELRLQEMLAANQTLSTAHMLCEQLRLLWSYRHRGYAERFLKNWVAMVTESDIPDLVRFAKSLWRSREGVLGYIRQRITSGPLEAFNNTIERILRRSCGVRDIDYLYLKVRQESLS